jgi:hypothetical protein
MLVLVAGLAVDLALGVCQCCEGEQRDKSRNSFHGRNVPKEYIIYTAFIFNVVAGGFVSQLPQLSWQNLIHQRKVAQLYFYSFQVVYFSCQNVQ